MAASGGLPASVTICECAVRDGLQHEPDFVPTKVKTQMVELFAGLGFQRIETTSFSHPAHVPQFADAEALLRELLRSPGVTYKATCVNAVAVRRAVATVEAGYGPTEISVVVSASESHSRRNVGVGHAEVQAQLDAVIGEALSSGLAVTGTVATAFGCPFSGPVPLADVSRWVEFFSERGVATISLGDTTGMGNPVTVEERCGQLLDRHRGLEWIGHFHDSRGLALANALAALRAGVRSLDAAFGGLGGHPANIHYGRGHTGNLATEDLVAALEATGVDTGIRLDRLVDAALEVERIIGRQLHGHIGRAGLVTDLQGNDVAGSRL